MKEYRISRGWRIFIYLTLPLLIAPFFIILLLPFNPSMNDDLNPDSYWFLIPMSLVMITILIYGLVYFTKEKFVIDSEKICLVSFFSKKEFRFD